jgi:preprotein translocase subunit SecY
VYVIIFLFFVWIKTFKVTIPLGSAKRKQRIKGAGYPIPLFYNDTTVVYIFQALRQMALFLLPPLHPFLTGRVIGFLVTHVLMQSITHYLPKLSKKTAKDIMKTLQKHHLFVRGHRTKKGEQLIRRYVRQASRASAGILATLVSLTDAPITTLYVTLTVLDDVSGAPILNQHKKKKRK